MRGAMNCVAARDGTATDAAVPSRSPSRRHSAPRPLAYSPNRWDKNGRPREEGVKLLTCILEAHGLRSIASLEKTLYFAVKFRHRGVEGFAPRIDDYGPLWA